MQTLKHIFSHAAKESPYTGAIFAQVFGKGDVISYRNSSGEQRQSMTIGFADHTKAVKGVLYDVSQSDTLEVGSVVLILNSIIKPETNTIVITKRTKLRRSSLQDKVPEDLAKQAANLVCPPSAAEVPLKNIQVSPAKTMVSVKGQIIAEEIERSVQVNGEPTKVKTIKLKDSTASCKISLWRQHAEEKNEIGSFIQLTNVVVQTYNEEKLLSTTLKTKMEKIEAPEEEMQVTVLAYQPVDGDFLTLTAEQNDAYPEYTVSLESMARAFSCITTQVTGIIQEKTPFPL